MSKLISKIVVPDSSEATGYALYNVKDANAIPASEKGVASGVATLDSSGKVPSSQLPSYADDVIEGYYHDNKFYATYTPGEEEEEGTYSDEITPELGKIYVDLESNEIYRWSGSEYIIISPSVEQIEVVQSTGNSTTAVMSLNATTLALLSAYESKQASEGGTDVSLVTTGEKYTWNNKGTYSKPNDGIPKTDLTSSLQSSIDKIDDIDDVIPVAATTSNQLADKAFVNSSIATSTATYRGDFNLVSDLSLTTQATLSDIATALATAISTADNNDYCYVLIPTADATPTEIEHVDRYKNNGTAWVHEYTLNNSGYTSVQWAAINSNITSPLVTKLSDLPTNALLTTLLAGYLPLTGGTITGTGNSLTIRSSNENSWIYFQNTISGTTSSKASVGYYSGLAFVANERTYARIGVNDSGTPQYWSGTSSSNAQTLIHSGNISSYNAGSATTLQTSRTLWGQSFNGSANVSGDMSSVGNITLNTNKYVRIGTAGEAGSSSKSGYISAGAGFSGNSGRYGLRILVCDQADAQTGLGQDLVTPTGWSNAYNLCVAGGNSSADMGFISFVTHKVNSTSYRYLGGFKDAAGTVTFQVIGNANATNFYATSDRSKKENIKQFSEHISKFTMKETGKDAYGVIAQDVPEMFRDGEEGSYTVNYNSVLSYYIGILENKVQKLEEELKELKQQIKNGRSDIN